MITVILECRDQEGALAVTLAALVQGAVEGLVAEVIVMDRGSGDGSSQLADAAGCRYLVDPDLREVVQHARGDWLFLIEPGARPLLGWIEHLGQHMAAGTTAARLSPSREYRLPFLARLRHRASTLEHGVLISRRHAVANARSGQALEDLARGLAMTRLKCEIVPAAVLSLA
ncbi:hypothetical protein DFR52_102457 [Hoeflea marina]|uniref:Glycosyl transferase family 2 n=1 Tax=Hoeflea marina TaxID=274592 RepID=A0A317PMP2_9HYPH|nr:glycosyl transferase [Hoeflea marina]PWW01793.1 hypothetical protein DFR52_102457 [Hoeflea marina]